MVLAALALAGCMGEQEQWLAEGRTHLNGQLPVNTDGGCLANGEPIGASGLRMLYELYLQFQGRAGQRQLANPRYGLTHNLGGMPHMNVSSVTIVGLLD